MLVALCDPDHVHHDLPHDWFSSEGAAGWATCPVTENGFLRVLSNPAYHSGGLRPVTLVSLLRRLCSGRGHHVWHHAVSLADGTLFDMSVVAGHRQLTDVYLLGLCRSSSLEFRHGRSVHWSRHMKSDTPVPTTISEYVAACPRKIQPVLRRVRAAIRKALPGAEEVISYRIPAFKLHGRVVVYFAAWAEHYAVYPFTRRTETAFRDEAAGYDQSGKGTIRFPYSEPVPAALIEGIARFRAQEVVESAMTRSRATRKTKRR